MQCRPACGACCIAPSIARAYHGMPNGKAADEACVHLDESMRCLLFGDPRRPACCSSFTAEAGVCGADREQALALLGGLETLTLAQVATGDV
jgi:hypothetical protein